MCKMNKFYNFQKLVNIFGSNFNIPIIIQIYIFRYN